MLCEEMSYYFQMPSPKGKTVDRPEEKQFHLNRFLLFSEHIVLVNINENLSSDVTETRFNTGKSLQKTGMQWSRNENPIAKLLEIFAGRRKFSVAKCILNWLFVTLSLKEMCLSVRKTSHAHCYSNGAEKIRKKFELSLTCCFLIFSFKTPLVSQECENKAVQETKGH